MYKNRKNGIQSKSVNIVRTTDIKTISVVINGIKIEALLDTGSDVNLIREDISMKIGNPELLPTNRVFMGLGNVLTIPIGKLHRYLNINDNLFQDDILVVSRNVMTTDLILGHTLLEEAEVTI